MRLFKRKNPYRDLEKQLCYSFRHAHFLETALLHPSFRFESRDIESDNQRLEFLGDSILSLVSTDYLFKQFPDLDEGALTTMRSRLTSGNALEKVARHIGLGPYLKLGKGERQTGGHERASNIADAMEALLGAAYLDGGVKAVTTIFKKLFLPMFDISPDNNWQDNPKGELQQITQARWNTNPVYRLSAQQGPAHARHFTMEVLVNGNPIVKVEGPNKRQAEQSAAAEAIKCLRKPGDMSCEKKRRL